MNSFFTIFEYGIKDFEHNNKEEIWRIARC